MAKPAGVRRLVLLGDSMTRGLGVPPGTGWEPLLERDLNARYTSPAVRQFELLNFGVSGYRMTQMLDVGLEVAPRFKPDVYVRRPQLAHGRQEMGPASRAARRGRHRSQVRLPPSGGARRQAAERRRHRRHRGQAAAVHAADAAVVAADAAAAGRSRRRHGGRGDGAAPEGHRLLRRGFRAGTHPAAARADPVRGRPRRVRRPGARGLRRRATGCTRTRRATRFWRRRSSIGSPPRPTSPSASWARPVRFAEPTAIVVLGWVFRGADHGRPSRRCPCRADGRSGASYHGRVGVVCRTPSF